MSDGKPVKPEQPKQPEPRDAIADAIWIYGSAWLGAGLLGFYAAGTNGAIVALVVAVMGVALGRGRRRGQS